MSEPGSRRRRRTILVLDDDGSFLDEIHELLALRCNVLLAASVSECIRVLRPPQLSDDADEFEEASQGVLEAVDLLLLHDLAQPNDVSALLGVAEQLQPDAAVIVTTDSGTRAEAWEQQFERVEALLRPYRPEDFRSLVQRVLSRDAEFA